MSSTFTCWKCGANLPSYDRNKVPFRAVCDKCDADLHVCKNCVHWNPSKPNQCEVPGTDFVSDRERSNMCEEFELKGKKGPDGPSKEDIARRLFKD